MRQLLFFVITLFLSAQDMSIYEGNWEAKLSKTDIFKFSVTIKQNDLSTYIIILSNGKGTFESSSKIDADQNLYFKFPNNTTFKATLDLKQNTIRGFLHSGMLLYHILLKKVGNAFTGELTLAMVPQLSSTSIYLSVEDANGDHYAAYPIFADQRFTGTWCGDFKRDKEKLIFKDYKTGLQFNGTLGHNKISLNILLANEVIETVDFKKSEKDWVFFKAPQLGIKYNIPEKKDDKIQVSELKLNENGFNLLEKMVKDINDVKLEKTHSILITQNNELVYEKYFEGYTSEISHDQRSASKSISSAMIGIGIQNGLIKSEHDKMFTYIPKKYQNLKTVANNEIKISDLLTMSSGIDAVDFGIKRQSAASEDSYQQTPDWTKTILSAPMINKPGEHALYSSANPHLLGIILKEVIQKPLDLFMDQNLFKPLSISNYIIQTDVTENPYFGGGMYLKPRDMIKFGLLYLNDGKFDNKQIIQSDWIQKSFKKSLVLENSIEKNDYGFLWWHKTYKDNSKFIKSVEARGAGGQYIFVIKELDMVIAITSGNYRNGKFMQPEKIMEEYILPAMLQSEK